MDGAPCAAVMIRCLPPMRTTTPVPSAVCDSTVAFISTSPSGVFISGVLTSTTDRIVTIDDWEACAWHA